LKASRTADTTTLLNRTAALILTVHMQTNEDIPSDMHGLVKWLNNHHAIPPSAAEFDVTKLEIHDAWSNNLILVGKDGIPIGVGSPGENGVWDNGKSDDLCVFFDSVHL
jgi:hypothetical protein